MYSLLDVLGSENCCSSNILDSAFYFLVIYGGNANSDDSAVLYSFIPVEFKLFDTSAS